MNAIEYRDLRRQAVNAFEMSMEKIGETEIPNRESFLAKLPDNKEIFLQFYDWWVSNGVSKPSAHAEESPIFDLDMVNYGATDGSGPSERSDREDAASQGTATSDQGEITVPEISE